MFKIRLGWKDMTVSMECRGGGEGGKGVLHCAVGWSVTIFSSTAVELSPHLTTVSQSGVLTRLSPFHSLAALSSTLR